RRRREGRCQIARQESPRIRGRSMRQFQSARWVSFRLRFASVRLSNNHVPGGILFCLLFQFRELLMELLRSCGVISYVVVFTSRLTDFCGSMRLSLLGAVFPKAVTARPPLSSR